MKRKQKKLLRIEQLFNYKLKTFYLTIIFLVTDLLPISIV